MYDLKLVNVVSAQSRNSNPDLILAKRFLELAGFPVDSPIVIEIYDGQIILTTIPFVTH